MVKRKPNNQVSVNTLDHGALALNIAAYMDKDHGTFASNIGMNFFQVAGFKL